MHNLKLHERIAVRDDLYVTRVDGGFLYEYYRTSKVKYQGNDSKRLALIQVVFVPEVIHIYEEQKGL